MSSSKDAGAIIHPFVVSQNHLFYSQNRQLFKFPSSEKTVIFSSLSTEIHDLSKPLNCTDHFLIERTSAHSEHILALWKQEIQNFGNVMFRSYGRFLFVSDFRPLWCSFWKYSGMFWHQVLFLHLTDRTKPIWQQKTVRIVYWAVCYEVSHKCFHWVTQGQSQASGADDRQRAVDICLLFCFRPVVKITDTVSLSLLPSVLSCTVQRNWILSLKLSTSGWSFSEAQTARVITDRSIPCGVPSQLTLLAQEMMRSMRLWHWQAPERRQLHLLEKCSPLVRLGGSALSLLC